MSNPIEAGKAFMAKYKETFNALAAEESTMNKQDTDTFDRLTKSLEHMVNAMEASTKMVLILHEQVQQLKAQVAYLMGDTYQ